MLRARLLAIDLLGLLIEAATLMGSAYLLFRADPALDPVAPAGDIHPPGAEGPATQGIWLVLLLHPLAYALWQQIWLARLQRFCTAHALNPVERMYVLASRLPQQSLLVRPLLWLVCGVLWVAWLTWHGLPPGSQIALLGLFALTPLIAGAIHNLLYDRFLWGVAWRPLGERPSDLRRFAGRYSLEIGRATLICSGMALLCTVAFALSAPFAVEPFQRAQRYLPLLLLLLLLAGHRYGLAAMRPIRRYLRDMLGPGGAAKQTAAAAYQAAQALPYRLAGTMVVAGLVAAAVLLGLVRPLLDLPGEGLVLILGVAFSVTTAAALYAIIWHRYTLRTLLGHLRAQYSFHPDEVPAPLSLIGKMVWGFGLPVLCVCMLSLLFSFVQYKTLANRHVQRLAQDRIGLLADELSGALGTEVDADRVRERIRTLVEQSGLGRESIVYYVPDTGHEAHLMGHPPGIQPPWIPPSLVAHLRLRSSGTLDLPRLSLTGGYRRLQGGRPGAARSLGILAVLYPNYRHPGVRGMDRDPLRGQLIGLILFFAVLMFVSGGVVVIAAVDLSRPLRELERRAALMAGGDLSAPLVQTAVEVDEAGALAFAFEEMRRALSEMLRSSAALNKQLEADVAQRTAELSRRDREVSEATTRLQLARSELLRTEKLATMGRIAASITSEINDPVSAMVAIPGPLLEELAELERLCQAQPLQPDRIQASLLELRRMVDVLQRSAHRTKEIVRATRIYTRLGDDRIGPVDLAQVVEEVLRLFGELARWGVQVVRDQVGPVPVLAVRSDLGQLLSGWLARRSPLLREQRGGGRLHILLRRLPEVGEAELTISDTGPELSPAGEDPLASGVCRRFAGRLTIGGGAGQPTWLRLRLPLAETAPPASGPPAAGGASHGS
ncbi:MAG: HAMP domain-containing protein [Myxococcota bacterium]|nr:HAMP domain-containing protein [Myxococcota bacterium]